jgi:DNA repair protein RadA/Sms
MFKCSKCGRETPVWSRSCPVCCAEKTLKKQTLLSYEEKTDGQTSQDQEHLPTGFQIFDRIFDGGFLRGFVYLIHAMWGAGKTTFLLQACAYLVSLGKSVVYFSFDESAHGIRKKCNQYKLSHLPVFICENSSGVIERTLLEYKPDFVVVDSLQSLAEYEGNAIVGTLYRIRKEAQKQGFPLVVIGEERKDGTNYLGSASIGFIVDVPVKMSVGLDEDVIINTPNKNRDTDDKVSRCFFRKTPSGMIEIPENQTGYRSRHKKDAIVGLAAFIAREGNEFYDDAMTTAIISGSKKSSLTVSGMNSSKAKNLLAMLENHFLISKNSFVARSNRTEKLRDDAELACLMSILSEFLKMPIPVDTVFIGGIDNRGYLLPVEGMERRVKRAEALGYKRIIGPKANGTQLACWEEIDTIDGVKRLLGFIE